MKKITEEELDEMRMLIAIILEKKNIYKKLEDSRCQIAEVINEAKEEYETATSELWNYIDTIS